jgi:cell division protein ZapE
MPKQRIQQSLLQRYYQDQQRAGFQRDPAPEEASAHQQRRHGDLTALNAGAASGPGLLGRLLNLGRAPRPRLILGLYMWGGVGRGKTYLMDLFYTELTIAAKQRTHFHRFMQYVHSELKTLKDQQSPLIQVAAHLAEQTRIICLDEFFVSDITDAMLLSGLLQALFERNVTLVTTSNIAPDDLYKEGLQRARFVPAIELIKTRMEVFHLDGATDYRLRFLQQADLFHAPLDARADDMLAAAFEQVSMEPGQPDQPLAIEGRRIPTRRLADGVVWFDFEAICDGPRGQADYIEIARCFHTVLISNIPILDGFKENQARRFLTLVDEFYDRSVKLIVSAAAAIDELYQGAKLRFEYQRTLSRLKEMQSREYLEKPHLP